ncbi:MAG: protein kinase family protein [Simkaniaceae bacterium]|nr:protein kinase family protein [Simkaniaceae bacterium]
MAVVTIPTAIDAFDQAFKNIASLEVDEAFAAHCLSLSTTLKHEITPLEDHENYRQWLGLARCIDTLFSKTQEGGIRFNCLSSENQACARELLTKWDIEPLSSHFDPEMEREVLGKGSSARVIALTDNVAAKILKNPDLTASEVCIHELMPEHPNILRPFACTSFLIFMERLPKSYKPLNNVTLNFHAFMKAFHSLFSAIGHLQENGIIHCDIKPQNILTTEDGDLKLLDFGLATTKNVARPPYYTYSAPEQAAPADEKHDVRFVDTYSAACLALMHLSNNKFYSVLDSLFSFPIRAYELEGILRETKIPPQTFTESSKSVFKTELYPEILDQVKEKLRRSLGEEPINTIEYQRRVFSAAISSITQKYLDEEVERVMDSQSLTTDPEHITSIKEAIKGGLTLNPRARAHAKFLATNFELKGK